MLNSTTGSLYNSPSIASVMLHGHIDENGNSLIDLEMPAASVIDDIFLFMQIGEGVAVIAPRNDEEKKEPCKRIYLHAFQGARDAPSMAAFLLSMEIHKENGTQGPSAEECLLYTGHVGVSFNAKSPIYGFNPDTGDLPGWKVIEQLKDKKSSFAPYPGIVTDDSVVFNMAKAKKLDYRILEYVFPESQYNLIYAAFNKARAKTGLTYSFPGQGGDCNCATWPQTIDIPIPAASGIMRIYIKSFNDNDVKRMGECCD